MITPKSQNATFTVVTIDPVTVSPPVDTYDPLAYSHPTRVRITASLVVGKTEHIIEGFCVITPNSVCVTFGDYRLAGLDIAEQVLRVDVSLKTTEPHDPLHYLNADHLKACIVEVTRWNVTRILDVVTLNVIER